jgi:hypothetical protein
LSYCFVKTMQSFAIHLLYCQYRPQILQRHQKKNTVIKILTRFGRYRQLSVDNISISHMAIIYQIGSCKHWLHNVKYETTTLTIGWLPKAYSRHAKMAKTSYICLARDARTNRLCFISCNYIFSKQIRNIIILVAKQGLNFLSIW